MIEFRGKTVEEAGRKAEAMIEAMQAAGLGYHFPKVTPPQSKSVWTLRAAGFGVLSNMKGDAKPIEFIEDTAVALADLPAYIQEFSEAMDGFRQQVVYYAHAGAGELHLRPSVNLKTSEGVRQMREIAEFSARLVKKYGVFKRRTRRRAGARRIYPLGAWRKTMRSCNESKKPGTPTASSTRKKSSARLRWTRTCAINRIRLP